MWGSRPVEHAAALETVRTVAERVLTNPQVADGSKIEFTVPCVVDGTLPASVTFDSVSSQRTIAHYRASRVPHLPYFFWAMTPVLWWARQAALRRAARMVDAELRGETIAPSTMSRLAPPVPFSHAQAAHLTTVAAITALASYGGSLFTQQLDYIGDSYGASNPSRGVALAICRFGVVFALVAGIAADRVGRRRVLLGSVIGICITNGLSALAPNFAIFTAPQVINRGLLNAAFSVAAISVVEDAPERARAYALSMLMLAAGTGFAVGVLLLPLSDLGGEVWRLVFGLSTVTLIVVPGMSKRLRETKRFERLLEVDVHRSRGRVREVLSHPYVRRFALLAVFVYFLQIFVAPGAQFSNQYLRDDRGFSGLDITIFRSITAGLPGLAGLLIGGRLAETRGRRPVALASTFLGTGAAMVLFVTAGWALWTAATVSTVLGAVATPAVGSYSTEMFPTEVRGTANALLTIAGVAGSATGLISVGYLSDHISLGSSIALMGIVPLLVTLIVLPRLPEASGRRLEDVSPSELLPPGL